MLPGNGLLNPSDVRLVVVPLPSGMTGGFDADDDAVVRDASSSSAVDGSSEGIMVIQGLVTTFSCMQNHDVYIYIYTSIYPVLQSLLQR